MNYGNGPYNGYGNNSYISGGLNYSSYNPYYNSSNQIQPNIQQLQMNQYAFVNGIEGAKAFQVQANQTMLLMDNDKPICYMKTSNNIGQSTLRYFTLTEVDENSIKNLNNTEPQQPKYATEADFKLLSDKVDSLYKTLNKSNKDKQNG